MLLSMTKLMVHTVIFTYDSTDTGVILVKDAGGNVIGSINAASSSPIILETPGSNAIDLHMLQVDVSVNGKGPYVGYGVT